VPDDRPPRIRNEINRDNPRERGRHFLAARLMPLRPKDAETGGPAGPESARMALEPERRLPHDFRRRLVEQYRHHQRADAAAGFLRRAARLCLPGARYLLSGPLTGADVPALGGWDSVVPGFGHGLPPGRRGSDRGSRQL
jgi:hypothetical protein